MPGTQDKADTTQTPSPDTSGTVVHSDSFDQDAHDREVYRRMIQDNDGEPGAVENAPKGPAKVRAIQDKKPHPAASKDPKGEPSKGDASIDQEQAAIADAVLRRDGIPETARKRIIDGASPEELQEIVEKRRKVQQDTDRLGNELAQARRTPTGKPKGEQSDDSASELTEGLTPKQAAMIQKVMAEGDEDRAQELAAAFRDGAIQPGSRVKHEQRETPAGRQSAEEREGILLVKLQKPLENLKAEYPELSSVDSQLQVIRAAQRMLEAGVFEDDKDPETGQIPIDKILAKACSVKLGTVTPQQRQRQMIERNYRQRNGQPDASPARGKAEAPLTPDQRERAAYRLLREGKNPDEIPSILASS